MTATTQTSPSHAHRADKALALALALAHAEESLQAFTSGQVDAIVDPSGHTYLLRRAQEDLRQNESRLQALLDSAADVITVVNHEGEIVSQSHAVSKVLGYEPEELVGSSIFELIHEDDLSAVHSAYFNVSEGFNENATAQFRHRACDGSYRLIEATVGKLRDASSASVVMTCRDATHRREEQQESVRREAACAQTSLAKDRFLAMLSHELRTPLTPALLGIQALLEDERFAAAKPTLTMIRRNIELQSQLLEELIDFTAVGQYKVRLRLESLDAHEAVRFVLEICQGEIAAAQIEILLDLRASENMVQADSVRLQQVMWNLVKNAIKFSTPGSSISITSANDALGHLTFEFVDHGVGIEPELLPRVFDSFQQGDLAMQKLYGGLGLGMFIAKGLAEAQGGTLTVASEGRGQGATFRLTLNTATTAILEETAA